MAADDGTSNQSTLTTVCDVVHVLLPVAKRGTSQHTHHLMEGCYVLFLSLVESAASGGV